MIVRGLLITKATHCIKAAINITHGIKLLAKETSVERADSSVKIIHQQQQTSVKFIKTVQLNRRNC